jgi:hypothetical protein
VSGGLHLRGRPDALHPSGREAIYYEDDVPDKWKDFYNANVEFFSDLGSPGGAAKTGKIGKDHPLVAALPPQGEGH